MKGALDCASDNDTNESSSDDPMNDVVDGHERTHVGHLRALESALSNDAFLGKTKFSQEKYLRKKYRKYAKEITILKPTIADFCEANPAEIRSDMLGSLLRFSGTQSGSIVAAIDDVAGILTAALLQIGCKVERYVFGKNSGQERCQHMFGLDKSENVLVKRDAADTMPGRVYDSIVIAHNGTPEFDVEKAFQQLVPFLKVSGTIALYARNIEPLLSVLYQLRIDSNSSRDSSFINVQLTEQMCREQEIIQHRTHPVMQQSIFLFKGFILSGIKVSE